MKTIIKKIDRQQPEKEIIEEAGQFLRAGRLVAFPTETVYGLGADALNEDAARKIYQAKGRPSDNPLIVHITNMEDLVRITSSIPDQAYIVADRYWPGPLTMIFEKSDAVPMGTTGGLSTVAVRMPSDAVARAVIDAGGGFIAAPSANTSGRPSPTTAAHVVEDLYGKVDMILHGGPVEIGVESTILDMTVTPPMILRPGAVTEEMLRELLGEVSVDTAVIDAKSQTAPKAPGMKYRHYAPKATLCVVEGSIDKVVGKINELSKEKARDGYKVGVIGTEETVKSYKCDTVKCIGVRGDDSSIASHLYGILREFDEEDVEYIYSESFTSEGIGKAVMNRLLKAAGHHVIYV